MELSSKIMEQRKRMGLSQEKLAEHMGVSRQAITRWEAGQSLPELEKVVRLSEFFAVSCDYLLKDGVPEETVPKADREPPVRTLRRRPLWQAIFGGGLAGIGVAGVAAMWIISRVYPVTVWDWDGTYYHGLTGFLTVRELWPVFWFFIALAALGLGLLAVWFCRRRGGRRDGA